MYVDTTKARRLGLAGRLLIGLVVAAALAAGVFYWRSQPQETIKVVPDLQQPVSTG